MVRFKIEDNATPYIFHLKFLYSYFKWVYIIIVLAVQARADKCSYLHGSGIKKFGAWCRFSFVDSSL